MKKPINDLTEDELRSLLASVLDSVSVAYGYLWHVNNEPGTPQQYAPEQAAYRARFILRDLLSSEQRGNGINEVKARMNPRHPHYGIPCDNFFRNDYPNFGGAGPDEKTNK